MRMTINVGSTIQVKGKAAAVSAATALDLSGKKGKRAFVIFDGANPAAVSIGLDGTAATTPTVPATKDATGYPIRPVAGDVIEFVSTSGFITDIKVVCAAAQDVYYCLTDV